MDAISVNTVETQSLRVVHRQRDWGTPILLLLVFLLLSGAIVVYASPWADLTYRYSRAAVPERPVPDRPLAANIASWCVELNPYGTTNDVRTPMRDDGTAGDLVAGDGIYSLQTQFAGTGTHYWRAAACENPGINFPSSPAWLWIEEAGQQVVLTFDTNRYAKGEAKKFLPDTFVAEASDQLPPLHVFGSVNDWRRADEETRLQDIREDRYRLVYTVPREGAHSAAVTFEDENGRLHGYMGDGRSESWNMLRFETGQPNELVVFEVDANSGRTAILYDVSPGFAWLALRNGRDILSLVVGGLALVLAYLALKRYELLRRPDLYVEAGCPDCGAATLIRVPRTSRMRLARYGGLKTGYYECGQCTWHGARFLGGNKTSILSGVRPLAHWLPLVVPMTLLLVSASTAVFLRSELGASPILFGGGQTRIAEVDSDLDAAPTTKTQETFDEVQGSLERSESATSNTDMESEGGRFAAQQPDTVPAVDDQGFSPIQYGTRPTSGKIE